MNSSELILDTDILSLLFRNDDAVIECARVYLREHQRLTISIITRYEILRGLKAKDAERQILRFNEFCAANRLIAITEDVIERAAGIYAELYRTGKLIGDADILIAASALVNNCGLVTNNEAHFSRVAGLRVDNWAR